MFWFSTVCFWNESNDSHAETVLLGKLDLRPHSLCLTSQEAERFHTVQLKCVITLFFPLTSALLPLRLPSSSLLCLNKVLLQECFGLFQKEYFSSNFIYYFFTILLIYLFSLIWWGNHLSRTVLHACVFFQPNFELKKAVIFKGGPARTMYTMFA